MDDDIDESQAPFHLRREPRGQLRFIHRVLGQELPFDLDEESAGAQTWFALIGPTLNALRSGRILLFDEIDASLHPRLSACLLELFQDPETNPYGAQLIFTTHDTSLVNLPALADGASGSAAWLGLPGITSLTSPRPTGLA
ncbi:MAG: AAA family ATPase [Acidimicrobiales bacterium]